MRYAEQITMGHGRLEKRRLWVLPIYDDFLAWPGACLMLRLERTFIKKATGELSCELDYALTSPDADQLTSADLLTLWRNHWHIENRLHYVRDVTFGEDTSRVRTHHAPTPSLLSVIWSSLSHGALVSPISPRPCVLLLRNLSLLWLNSFFYENDLALQSQIRKGSRRGKKRGIQIHLKG